ncbi:hypothetical protein BHE74_00058089 [Ensete ventricosum]|nr:hypothetical protein BHE74_00058089 [Ensete ventricosum]
MAETYRGRATGAAWGRGMGRHAALMGMGQAASCSGTFTSDSRSDADLVPRVDVASSKVFLRMRCEITRGNAGRRDGLTWRCLLLKGQLAYSLGGSIASSGSQNDAVHIIPSSMMAKDHFSFSSFLSLRTSHLSVALSFSASLPIRSK